MLREVQTGVERDMTQSTNVETGEILDRRSRTEGRGMWYSLLLLLQEFRCTQWWVREDNMTQHTAVTESDSWVAEMYEGEGNMTQPAALQ